MITTIYWLVDMRRSMGSTGRPFYCGKTSLRADENTVIQRLGPLDKRRVLSRRLRQCGKRFRVKIIATVLPTDDANAIRKQNIDWIKRHFPDHAHAPSRRKAKPAKKALLTRPQYAKRVHQEKMKRRLDLRKRV